MRELKVHPKNTKSTSKKHSKNTKKNYFYFLFFVFFFKAKDCAAGEKYGLNFGLQAPDAFPIKYLSTTKMGVRRKVGIKLCRHLMHFLWIFCILYNFKSNFFAAGKKFGLQAPDAFPFFYVW